METVNTIAWEFGGPLTKLPTFAAFLLLTALFIWGGFFIVQSYRKTLQHLTLRRRVLLGSLRILLLLAVIYCLANPTRVERTYLAQPDDTSAVILVDHSASMTTPDNRGRTRLDYAVRNWHRYADQVTEHYDDVKVFQFDAESQAVVNSDLYPETSPGRPETQLLTAMKGVLAAERPSALFVITDGLDTGEANPEETTAAIKQWPGPIYFIVGENRIASDNQIRIRQIDTPSRALRNTSFPVQMVLEAQVTEERRLPVRLEMNGQLLVERNIQLAAGHNLFPFSTEVNSGEPGERLLTLTVGEGDQARIFHRAVSVMAELKIRVLYYQGTPDWGFRFINTIFAREPSIDLTSIFKPTDKVTLTSGQDELEDLPENVTRLSNYNVILLSHAHFSQLSELRQKALQEYVRQGGGILFILPNAVQAAALKGSTLEQMLPVFLASPNEVATDAAAMQQQLQRLRNMRSQSKSELEPFALASDTQYGYIFQNAEGESGLIYPRFTSSAPAFRAKAGANVLAYHPTEKDVDGRRGILLALQRYGEGHTALLATDPLWRWKLSVPSDSHEPEQFWQQLLHAIASPVEFQIRFERAPVEVVLGESVSLSLLGAANIDGKITVTALSPDGQITLLETVASIDPDRLEAHWTPNAQVGEWQLIAQTGEIKTRQFVNVTPSDSALPDRAHEAPDYTLMQQLASSSGGAILESNAPLPWFNEINDGPQLLSESKRLLWNIWPIFMFAALIYVAELFLRRRWKLL